MNVSETPTGWFQYRLPGERHIVRGAGKITEGFGAEGFAVEAFDNRRRRPLTILAETSSASEIEPVLEENSACPHESLSHEPAVDLLPQERDWYFAAIRDIQDMLASTDRGKMVLARCIETSGSVSSRDMFHRLCRAYPEAFVFNFHIPEFGEWIGATPELLLECSGGTLRTMALAGTRPRSAGGADQTSWDEKNLEEQQMVTDYIVSLFHANGLKAECGRKHTQGAGPVEHICTPVRARMPQEGWEMERFLQQLSPTPALCGSRKELAMETLSGLEPVDRRLYGGWCGPVSSAGNFHLFVNLRSGTFLKDGRLRLYSGSGITLLSDPEEEWKETDRKARTLLRYC